jgi:XTP/dITP diphosphohydrolase
MVVECMSDIRTIVVVSRNQGKIREFKRIFSDYVPDVKWRFLSAIDLGLPEVEETGSTFAENARIKALAGAKYLAGTKYSGYICLGEDSGLEVDKLDGGPGVNSHRFSESGSDEDNNKLLLDLLDGVPWDERTCRYKAAIALADSTGIIAQSTGSVEGIIHTELRGTNGFGYDPLFYAVELGKTFGEASDAEKDAISHRRRAIQGLIPAIKRIML